MAKIVFPATNRVHQARQQLLFDELSKSFEVLIADGEDFGKDLDKIKPDLVLIRGDRYEQLPLATTALYKGYRIAHIEGGDLSGVVDNKVRHAITQLADIHFATNKESYARLISMGTDPDMTFNFGSLDVEYANEVNQREEIMPVNEYAVYCFHPFPEENGEAIKLKFLDIPVKLIKSNKDYGTQNDGEEYEAGEYIKILRDASILVGNSSSFLKEASIFGTPVVNVGTRQQNRLTPRNVMSVPHNQDAVKMAIDYQLKHGRYKPDMVYFQEGTSVKIANKLKELL